MIDETATVQGQIDGVNPHLVTVGRKCVVGDRAALLTHCPIRGSRPVVIGDYVWIGYAALILPGVTIGDRCVIGAGSVVTKNVPATSIVAGNPARVLRALSEQEEKELVYRLEHGLPMGKDDAV